MGQKRYGLSDADMLSINEQIDSASNGLEVMYKGISATWNAILAQEGMTFGEALTELKDGKKFQPTEFAIPFDQSIEITERMKNRMIALDVSEIGISSLLIDWVNIGPSTYNDMPQTKAQATDNILPPYNNTQSGSTKEYRDWISE